MDRITARLAADMPLDMIPGGIWQEIAEQIGVDNMFKVLEVIGGATIYAPKIDTLIKPQRDKQIQAEFNGYNHMELARRYNLTERAVRELCGAGHIEGQISLFQSVNEKS